MYRIANDITKGIRASKDMTISIVILWAVLSLVVLPTAVSANTSSDMPSGINSPSDLAAWLKGNFEYEMQLADRWQTPEETVLAKKGDCDDFAVLASSILNRISISNKIVVIKFEGSNVGHAVCIFKDKEGFYSYISNCELVSTKATSIEGAIEEIYYDWDTLTYSNPGKGYFTVVKKTSSEGQYSESRLYTSKELPIDTDLNIASLN